MPVKMQLLGVFISAKAGNLDIEQLDQRGSVKLHLIKRVAAVQSYCLVLLCIANKQPGFKKQRGWRWEHKTPLCIALQAAPGSHLVLPAVPSLLLRQKKERRDGSCCTEVWHRCPFLFPHNTEAPGQLQGPFRWVQLTLWAGHGAVAVCPRQSLQCHRGEFPVWPLCVPFVFPTRDGLGHSSCSKTAPLNPHSRTGSRQLPLCKAENLSLQISTIWPIKVRIKHPKHSSSKTVTQAGSPARPTPSECCVVFWGGSLQV